MGDIMKHRLLSLALLLSSSSSFSETLYVSKQLSTKLYRAGWRFEAPDEKDKSIKAFKDQAEGTPAWMSPCQHTRCELMLSDGSDRSENYVFVVDRKTQYLGTLYDTWIHSIAALDLATGKEIWRTEIIDQAAIEARVVEWNYPGRNEKKTPAILVERRGGADLYDPKTGRVFETIQTTSNPEAIWSSGPYRFLIYGDLFIETQLNGDIIWSRTNADRFMSKAVGFFESTPGVVAFIYQRARRNGNPPPEAPELKVRFYNKETGAILATLPEANSMATEDHIFYLQHFGKIVAYDRKSLRPVWETSNNQGNRRAVELIVTDKYLFSAGNVLNLFDKQTGKLLTTHEAFSRCGESDEARFDSLQIGARPNTVISEMSSYTGEGFYRSICTDYFEFSVDDK
jgi:outer membrane protein assembly factor BamB